MKKKILLLATVLSAYMTFSAFAGEWKQDEKGWWYQSDDGSYPQDGWLLIDNKFYYFDDEGYMVADKKIGNFYVGADGAYIDPLEKSKSEIDLPKTDKKIGWEHQKDGKWKYKDEKGYYINRWLVDPKTNYKYHFDTFGNMNTGLCFIDNKWYNFSETGELYYGGEVDENSRSTEDGTVHRYDEPGFFSTIFAVFSSEKDIVGLELENHKNIPVSVKSRCTITDSDAKINETFYHFGSDGIECDMVIPAKGTERVYFSAPDLHSVNFNHGTTMIRVDITMADGEFWFEIPIYDINKYEDIKLITSYIEP